MYLELCCCSCCCYRPRTVRHHLFPITIEHLEPHGQLSRVQRPLLDGALLELSNRHARHAHGQESAGAPQGRLVGGCFACKPVSLLGRKVLFRLGSFGLVWFRFVSCRLGSLRRVVYRLRFRFQCSGSVFRFSFQLRDILGAPWRQVPSVSFFARDTNRL